MSFAGQGGECFWLVTDLLWDVGGGSLVDFLLLVAIAVSVGLTLIQGTVLHGDCESAGVCIVLGISGDRQEEPLDAFDVVLLNVSISEPENALLRRWAPASRSCGSVRQF